METRPLVVDGNSLVVRCIMATALDDLKAGGIWTGGVYGSLSSLGSLLSHFEAEGTPAHAVYMCFDHGVHPERLAAIPTYKSERKKNRELLSPEEKEKAFQQVDLCGELFTRLGLTTLRFENREADDTVAAVTQILVDAGESPIVVSGDRDLFQCVKMGAEFWYLNSKDKEIIDEDNFAENVRVIFKTKTGIRPEAYVLFRALVGDDSDSIEGVLGCGPVRAEQMINDCAAFVSENVPDADFFKESPETQLSLLVYMLSEHSGEVADLPAYKANLIPDHERLGRVLQGIDLAASFGPTALLKGSMQEALPYDRVAILRFLTKLKFNSVIGDERRFLGPFERLAKRRFSASRAN